MRHLRKRDAAGGAPEGQRLGDGAQLLALGNPGRIGTPGAVTVISSSRGPTSGHVFLATGRLTPTHIEGLGGNQSDAVTLA